jgi:hypothetical protein
LKSNIPPEGNGLSDLASTVTFGVVCFAFLAWLLVLELVGGSRLEDEDEELDKGFSAAPLDLDIFASLLDSPFGPAMRLLLALAEGLALAFCVALLAFIGVFLSCFNVWAALTDIGSCCIQFAELAIAFALGGHAIGP